MAIELVDTHAHLGHPEFTNELPDIIRRAGKAGVRWIITVGVDLPSSEQAIALAQQFDGVFAAVGVHPTEAQNAPVGVAEALRKLVSNPKVVAIGETGYDFRRLPIRKSCQREVFLQHLEVASEKNLPVILHQRDSFSETMRELKNLGKPLCGVFHCFAGGVEEAQRVLDFDFFISFTGILTFKNADKLRAVARVLPLEKIMLETDSPYLAPHPLRGKRCEPAHTRWTAEKLAEVKGIPLEEVARVTTSNAQRLFGLK